LQYGKPSIVLPPQKKNSGVPGSPIG